MPPKLNRWIFCALSWSLATVLVMVLAWRWRFEQTRDEVAAEASVQLAANAVALKSALEKLETLPFVMSLEARVAQGLTHPDDAVVIDQLNRYLATIQQQAHVTAAYVIAPSGLTIAASNWNQSPTFVGNNYRFRPYVQSVMQGATGRFYGIGTTTAEPGYFLARPVFALDADVHAQAGHGGLIGTLVIKLNLDDFEKSWSLHDEPMALVDANGVIFLSNRAAWKYHSLAPLDDAAQRAIDITQQYAGKTITPLPATATGLRWPHRVEHPVDALDWRLVRYVTDDAARNAALNATMVSATLMVIAGLLAQMAYLRRQHARTAAAARQAVVDASSQLETRIAARTHDLLRANDELKQRYVEVHAAEQLLRHTQTELIQAGKLGMLGQMAAGVSHELSQPLTAMRTFATNAETFMDRDDIISARTNLGYIGDACVRMGKLLGQLKSFARKSHGTPGPVDLAQAIENSAHLLRNDFAQCGTTLDIQILQAAQVIGDSLRIEQVLINLIRNALDAVKPCEIRRVQVELSISANDHATVRINDTGPGIAPQALAHLFEPFFTTKPPGAGLGLGLAISSSIVQAMAGQLTVSNGAEGGAEFVLTLPLTGGVDNENLSP